jgi:hypothetical protein
VELRPIREGGTGAHSSGAAQPDIFPEGFESGTINVPGIAGLGAGIAYLLEQGLDNLARQERRLTQALVEGLTAVPKVTLYGPRDPERRTGVVSFNVAGIEAGELEERLDDEFGVIGRAGLHCNPGAHVALGTHAAGGTMRLSPGARMDDGLMNINIVEALGKLEILRHFPRLLAGTHIDLPTVQYFSANSLTVDAEPAQVISMDGDLFGETPATYSLMPGVLKVWCRQ